MARSTAKSTIQPIITTTLIPMATKPRMVDVLGWPGSCFHRGDTKAHMNPTSGIGVRMDWSNMHHAPRGMTARASFWLVCKCHPVQRFVGRQILPLARKPLGVAAVDGQKALSKQEAHRHPVPKLFFVYRFGGAVVASSWVWSTSSWNCVYAMVVIQ